MVAVSHANLSGTDLHEDKRIKQAVRAASTANLSLSAPGSTLDGVTLVAGDRILLKDQTTASQNGIYTWSSATSALVRASDANASAVLFYGFKVFVREGTTNAATYWTFTQTATITLETTSLTFAQDGASSGSFSGEVTGTDLKATGLTGSTSASRYVGATATGAPASGAHLLGDYVIDQTGKLWICTTAGTPGTWTQSGSVITGETTASDFKPSGLTGATAASRYVGATTSGAPASGTFAKGDYVIDQTGTIWICTTAGTPGTWLQVSGSGGGGSTSGGATNLLFDTTLTGSQATVSFSSIPAGYRDLRIRALVRCDNAAQQVMNMQFNGDSTTGHYTPFNSATGNGGRISVIPGTSTTQVATGGFMTVEILMPDYANATGAVKSASSLGAPRADNTLEGDGLIWTAASAQAITSIVFSVAASANFITGTQFRIYGEPMGYVQSGTAAAVATSGTITTSSVTSARVSPTGAVTGVILQAGTYAGQRVNVINEAVAANSVTFAASGTSNVADGTSDVIAGLTARLFVWDTGTSLWYRCA